MSTWISEPDTGRYAAMNKGARHAKGEYLLFLNGGDCLVDPGTLAESFLAFPAADLVVGDLIARRGDGTERTGRFSACRFDEHHLYSSSLPHPSTFIRRDLFERAGGYDARFKVAGDYDFFVKAILNLGASVAGLPRPVSVFYLGGISTCEAESALLRREKRRVRRRYFGVTYRVRRQLSAVLQRWRGPEA